MHAGADVWLPLLTDFCVCRARLPPQKRRMRSMQHSLMPTHMLQLFTGQLQSWQLRVTSISQMTTSPRLQEEPTNGAMPMSSPRRLGLPQQSWQLLPALRNHRECCSTRVALLSICQEQRPFPGKLSTMGSPPIMQHRQHRTAGQSQAELRSERHPAMGSPLALSGPAHLAKADLWSLLLWANSP